MPVFHTRTIESILEPVAQQVSRLVILHEEAEDGNAMPDLQRPVFAVSAAVANLAKVGRETIQSSDDAILRQDMPAALQRVESASKFLEEASQMLNMNPYSQPARKKLIDGSRGILQGTSSLLLCFDESEVRKIVRDCKRVLDYLAIVEVVDTLDDLVRFVQDLSPCLSKVSREVDARQQELTHQIHREILRRSLEEVKTLTPILICGMKIFIQIQCDDSGRGLKEAAVNRDYLAQRISDEINEIVRVLQLTTYDEEEWDVDNLIGMKRSLNIIDSKMQAAHDWLGESRALRGGVGEKSVRCILEEANKIAKYCPPDDRDPIQKACDDISCMTDGLCELRQHGDRDLSQSGSLARGIEQRLHELTALVGRAVTNSERSGIMQPAHTVTGRLDQARRWLTNPTVDDKGLGQQAIALVLEEARKVCDGLPANQYTEMINLSDAVDSLHHRLSDLTRRGEGNSKEALAIANELLNKLPELKKKIHKAVVIRVVEDFVDTASPLKAFNDAVRSTEGTPAMRENTFIEKANALTAFSNRVSKTARMVAAGGCGDNKKLAEALLAGAAQVDSLLPQVINAGRIRMVYPDSQGVNEHFENLRAQYNDSLNKVRLHCDEAIDAGIFIQLSEDIIKKHTALCDNAIMDQDAEKFVENASAIARLANRVLMVGRQEADNSEDNAFNETLTRAADRLQTSVPKMVHAAKSVAVNPNDYVGATKWKDANREVQSAVADLGNTTTIHSRSDAPLLPPPPDIRNLCLQDNAPPRPPSPEEAFYRPPSHLDPDAEAADNLFKLKPQPNQPIMLAAHGLHQEVRQWSSQDNNIVAAAKRMALLMARLSQLVRGEGGNKKDLIACAKEIAEASEEVTRLAKELARGCTDKRMRTSLLQVCERIPTIGTQLKILSTVKATMLGAQDTIPRRIDAEVVGGTEEDREATDMLVGNAQNLMQSVKETVRVAEAASIKMRSDAGGRLRWVRQQPWYQY